MGGGGDDGADPRSMCSHFWIEELLWMEDKCFRRLTAAVSSSSLSSSSSRWRTHHGQVSPSMSLLLRAHYQLSRCGETDKQITAEGFGRRGLLENHGLQWGVVPPLCRCCRAVSRHGGGGVVGQYRNHWITSHSMTSMHRHFILRKITSAIASSFF